MHSTVPDAGISQDRVERGGEVRAAAADYELDQMRLIAQVHKQVAGLPGAPRPGGMLRDRAVCPPWRSPLDP
jgi:hypothetical protein